MEIPSLYISLLLLVASYLFTYHIRRKSSNHPPTVFPTLPIIGHLYLLKPPLYRTLAKISAEFGPILHLQFGSRGVLVINSPSLAEQCFTKNDITFANRPRMLFGKIAGNDWKSLVWSPYGDNWRNLRRIASVELLSIHRLNEFHDIRVDEGLEKKLAEFRVKRDAFFQELIEQLRKPKSENMETKKTMIEVLLSLQEAEPQYYNDEMIRSFVLKEKT
ncbi:putative cytochrome P450 [Helianthus debilis subsp. tardiflorus]